MNRTWMVSPSHDGLISAPHSLAAERTVVVIASAGRPEILAEAVKSCQKQVGEPFTGIISVPDERSLFNNWSLLDGWVIVTGSRGAAAQRNAALDVVPSASVIAFFDDDAVIRPDYLRNAVNFFNGHPEVVALTGRVLLDGANSAEVPASIADAALEQSCHEPIDGAWRTGRELYGCNFVVRGPELQIERFDARLPLYSWLEDHDIARRLMKHGVLAKVDDCVMVHRAAASGGRTSHVRLGYSQVMNPIYLWRKGSFPLWLVAHEIVPRTGKNVVRAVRGPDAGWRRERVAGNVKAWRDVLRGRITPERITEL